MKFEQAIEQLVPKVQALRAQWDGTQSILEQEQEAKAVTCTKGCGACCHFPLISSSSAEAFFLFVSLLSEGHSVQSLHEMAMRYADIYFQEVHRLGHLPFSQKAQTEAFHSMKTPCPFFDASLKTPGGLENAFTGGCSVFTKRPLICSIFNSTESPALCSQKAPHKAFASWVELGEQSSEAIRDCEREIFGKSALGHLPLLFASLTTETGLLAFLRVEDPLAPESDPHAQGSRDFFFYAELLSALGHQLSESDLLDLERSQTETR